MHILFLFTYILSIISVSLSFTTVDVVAAESLLILLASEGSEITESF